MGGLALSRSPSLAPSRPDPTPRPPQPRCVWPKGTKGARGRPSAAEGESQLQRTYASPFTPSAAQERTDGRERERDGKRELERTKEAEREREIEARERERKRRGIVVVSIAEITVGGGRRRESERESADIWIGGGVERGRRQEEGGGEREKRQGRRKDGVLYV
jgi:hypothetical protein